MKERTGNNVHDAFVGEAKAYQRLLQISQNKGIKTTIVNAETGAGLRLSQLGGLVCFAKQNRKKRE